MVVGHLTNRTIQMLTLVQLYKYRHPLIEEEKKKKERKRNTNKKRKGANNNSTYTNL